VGGCVGSTDTTFGRTENSRKNPDYSIYCSVQFSATAVMEMAIHAKKGDTIEVMGLLMGKIEGSVFYVLDVFPIPVEGTETRVNAQSQANEYIIKYLETLRESGNNDYVVGWYHSHPGYGCWLSGIDVNTQTLNQQFQDPFLAVVIDPHETIKMGEVSIGGFRTYPEDYSGSTRSRSQQSIPLEKIEDYGFHADKYYEVSKGFFKTESDEVALYIIQKEHWADLLAHGSSGRMKESIVVHEMKQISEKVGHAMKKRKDETRKADVMTANRPGTGKIGTIIVARMKKCGYYGF